MEYSFKEKGCLLSYVRGPKNIRFEYNVLVLKRRSHISSHFEQSN